MGNGVTKVVSCLTSTSSGHHSHRRRRRHDTVAVVSEPFCYDEGLGHSFCYVRPEPFRLSSSKVYNHEEKEREKERGKEDFSNPAGTTTFRSISGASISANTSTTPLSDFSLNTAGTIVVAAATFDCSDSFSSVPLQPIPRSVSGPLCGQLERGFLSGPIERGGFFSGPLDPKAGISIGIFSGPLELRKNNHQYSHYLRRSFSHGLSRKANLIRGLKRVIARTISFGQNAIVAPMKKDSLDVIDTAVSSSSRSGGGGESGDQSLDGLDQSNLHWAQGKAGEDRVHVVISEEYGWVFVGIYDGFNGPDAPDYLLSNLYPAVERELKGILCDENRTNNNRRNDDTSSDQRLTGDEVTKGKIKISKKKKSKRMLNSDWDMERLELDRKLKEQLSSSTITAAVDHNEVLKALSRALKSTEENYLDVADSMVSENPELALMGSCVLVMLMKGEDVYLVNVGDSRAVLGRKPEPDASDPIREEESSPLDRDGLDDDFGFPTLASLQLTSDHSTCVEEEVRRIKKEHPEDPSAVINDRVKGSLKVTRAFGAGFLKQPRWNEALLEMFRVDYVGTSPYITCNPSLHHHKLGRRDRFLILSSDGLYQYLTNEQAVAEVELFIAMYPEGDPAQHLVEEVLFRAAKKAGMEFHELLEIPQGDRRRYHDDVSIIVISLEGRIWRSCV